MPNCGECLVCCTLLPIDELNKSIGTVCQHYNNGCTIYCSKPKVCTDFVCAYLESSNTPESLRPDKCGIMFFKKTERIFSGVLVPGTQITDTARGQIKSFNKQGYSVVLLSTEKDEPYIMLADEHKSTEILNEYIEVINGNI